MLNKEAIQRVQSLYSKGIQSANSRLSNRHIFNTLSSLRATILSQEFKKGQRISDWAYQYLDCVPLEEVDLEGCPDKILKSVQPLPSILLGRNKYIATVTSINGDLTFNETTWKDKKFKRGNKYTATDPDFFIKDKYLYITVSTLLESVMIWGIFENPIEADRFVGCTGNVVACLNNLDFKFPFEEDLMPGLIKMAVEELLKEFNSNREDTSNNTRDNVVNEAK